LSDDCGATGSVTVIFTATDDCGNASTTSATFTIEDTTAPTIDNSNTLNIEIECGVTDPNALQTWLDNNAGASVSDSCGNITWSNDYGQDTDVKCDDGAITVTFTATDDCGNTSTTTATYIIKDTVDPVLTVPADITIECTEDSTPTNTGSASATDDCSATNVSFVDVETASCGITKTIIRTWTATDACGNTVSSDQIITVVDTTVPTFTVPADITRECDQDANDLALTGDVTDEADNCSSGLEATYADNVVAGECANESTITRTWTLVDECGNTT
jgi:hypothetical protein